MRALRKVSCSNLGLRKFFKILIFLHSLTPLILIFLCSHRHLLPIAINVTVKSTCANQVNVYPSYISSLIISLEKFLDTRQGVCNVAEAKFPRSRFLHLTYLKGTIIQARYICILILFLHKCSLLSLGGGNGGGIIKEDKIVTLFIGCNLFLLTFWPFSRLFIFAACTVVLTACWWCLLLALWA